jgi:hypothetical protein
MNPKITLISVDDVTHTTIVDFNGADNLPLRGNTVCYSVNLPRASFKSGIKHLQIESTNENAWFIKSAAFQVGDLFEPQTLNLDTGVYLDDQTGDDYKGAPASANWYFTTPFADFPNKTFTGEATAGTTASFGFEVGGNQACPRPLTVSDLHILSSRSFVRRKTSTKLVLPFTYPSNAIC